MITANKKNKKIKYGKVELPDDEFQSQNVKVRVTAFFDLELIDALRALAQEQGTKYQTLMNQKLREAVFGKKALDSETTELIKALVHDEYVKEIIQKNRDTSAKLRKGS